ncbi:hypothetical protein MN086_10085 [Sulfurovum sp. XGS-02]|uniref:hypothetical protein n=1 Tax=Sulfurovum sp. XGS-02 TaxID=2925411 RepID=UPI00206FF32A|nr:hypothetical protein [Sulfurovum sp. XGS-02]UPT77390.1 hypothetical protein MN086_10085 [Sulfurovum sp. XGS-02]
MNFKRIISIFIMGLLLSACASKEYVQQDSAYIIFKTPTFKYADMGFIYENEEEMKIEIYSSGQALISLEISETSICMSLLECMSKNAFNKEVLSAMYPEDILENIFRGRPLLHGTGLEKKGDGFTQKIVKTDKYNIDYSVLNKQIIFRDTINSILIQVKKQY